VPPPLRRKYDVTSTELDLTTFADLPLRPELLAVVEELGYTHPSPVQAEAIAPLVEGRDLIGQAATGTGKTAAFALPMLERLAEIRPHRGRGDAPFGLILAPTRELALQVSEAVSRYGARLGARVVTVYGGAPAGPQWKALQSGVDIVVATPGRAIDLMNRGALRLSELETVVLDEADEMLDMGFVEDIETLLDATPDTRQAVLFSATIPRRIETLAQKYLREPVTVRIRREEVPEGEAPKVRQTAYLVPRTHTTAALGRVLEAERPRAAIVFCRTRLDVDAVTETLTARGLRAEALHGGMDQEHRTRVVERLRSGRTELLVATDVAARGLDIDLLTHVVNHDVPQSSEDYVHRIGRVGRAGREGVAITLVPPSKMYALRNVERLTGQPITIAAVPTAADLRAARLDRTRAALEETLIGIDGEAGDAEDVRAMLAGLAAEHDLLDIATAAVQRLQAVAGTPDDGEDIPVVSAGRGSVGGRSERGERSDRPVKGRGAGQRPPKSGMTRLFVNAGRAGGVRPQDIVGALANESNLSGRDIGAIQIHERHALVEIPEHAADDVLRSLRGSTTLKGRRANVRRDRDFAGAGRDRS
jgi:ATP-dependent RNA helicase DeaD